MKRIISFAALAALFLSGISACRPSVVVRPPRNPVEVVTADPAVIPTAPVITIPPVTDVPETPTPRPTEGTINDPDDTGDVPATPPNSGDAEPTTAPTSVPTREPLEGEALEAKLYEVMGRQTVTLLSSAEVPFEDAHIDGYLPGGESTGDHFDTATVLVFRIDYEPDDYPYAASGLLFDGTALPLCPSLTMPSPYGPSGFAAVNSVYSVDGAFVSVFRIGGRVELSGVQVSLVVDEIERPVSVNEDTLESLADTVVSINGVEYLATRVRTDSSLAYGFVPLNGGFTTLIPQSVVSGGDVSIHADARGMLTHFPASTIIETNAGSFSVTTDNGVIEFR